MDDCITNILTYLPFPDGLGVFLFVSKKWNQHASKVEPLATQKAIQTPWMQYDREWLGETIPTFGTPDTLVPCWVMGNMFRTAEKGTFVIRNYETKKDTKFVVKTQNQIEFGEEYFFCGFSSHGSLCGFGVLDDLEVPTEMYPNMKGDWDRKSIYTLQLFVSRILTCAKVEPTYENARELVLKTGIHGYFMLPFVQFWDSVPNEQYTYDWATTKFDLNELQMRMYGEVLYKDCE